MLHASHHWPASAAAVVGLPLQLAVLHALLAALPCPACLLSYTPEEVGLGLHAGHDLGPLGHEGVALALHLRGHGVHDDGVPEASDRSSSSSRRRQRAHAQQQGIPSHASAQARAKNLCWQRTGHRAPLALRLHGVAACLHAQAFICTTRPRPLLLPVSVLLRRAPHAAPLGSASRTCR